MDGWLIPVVLGIVGIAAGVYIGRYAIQRSLETTVQEAEAEAKRLTEEAETGKNQVLVQAKEESLQLKDKIERELQKRQDRFSQREERLQKRQETLDKRLDSEKKRDRNLNKRTAAALKRTA